MLHRINKSVYGIVLLGAFLLLFMAGGVRQERRIAEKLRPEVLRFHVLAESDREADQQLKLMVRDVLISEMEPWLAGAADREEARRILGEHREDIRQLAERVLREQGCNLPVRVELTEGYFPVKRYGNLVLPAGEYETLRVSIGSAAGRNWWCMLFPGLCFVDGSYEMGNETAEELRAALTEEEFQAVWQEKETKVKVRFWIWEKLAHYME